MDEWIDREKWWWWWRYCCFCCHWTADRSIDRSIAVKWNNKHKLLFADFRCRCTPCVCVCVQVCQFYIVCMPKVSQYGWHTLCNNNINNITYTYIICVQCTHCTVWTLYKYILEHICIYVVCTNCHFIHIRCGRECGVRVPVYVCAKISSSTHVHLGRSETFFSNINPIFPAIFFFFI